MAIMRYEPASVVSQLQNDINRIFGNMNDAESSSATAQWMPAVDVREFVDRFELLVDLPGVRPGSVELTLEDSVLTISGERRDMTGCLRSRLRNMPRRSPSGFPSMPNELSVSAGGGG